VSESNNNAEFDGVRTFKPFPSGEQPFPRRGFENHENTVLNSNDTFALAKPKIIMMTWWDAGRALKLPRILREETRLIFSRATRDCGSRARRRSC